MDKDQECIHMAMGSVGRAVYHMGVKEGLTRALRRMSDPTTAPTARAAIAMEIEDAAKMCSAHIHGVLDEFEDHVLTGSPYRVIPPTAACVSFRSASLGSGAAYEVRCGCGERGTVADDGGLDDWLNEHRHCQGRTAPMNGPLLHELIGQTP